MVAPSRNSLNRTYSSSTVRREKEVPEKSQESTAYGEGADLTPSKMSKTRMGTHYTAEAECGGMVSACLAVPSSL